MSFDCDQILMSKVKVHQYTVIAHENFKLEKVQ